MIYFFRQMYFHTCHIKVKIKGKMECRCDGETFFRSRLKRFGVNPRTRRLCTDVRVKWDYPKYTMTEKKSREDQNSTLVTLS